MRRYFTILLFLLSPVLAFSQDHIFTTDGKDLTVTIKDIQQEDVTFVMFGDSTEKPFILPKKEIQKIVFANGIEERFGNADDETTIIQNDKNNPRNPDKIVTTDGKTIYCEVVEKKRFGVNYIPAKADNNYVEYIPNTKIDRIEYANGDVDYVSGTPDNNRKRKNPKDFSYLSPHYISVNTGPAIPFGLFGNGASFGSGNASTGVDVNIDGTYYLYRGLGFGLMGGYTFNPFNDVNYRSFIQSFFPSPNNTDVSINVGDWHNAYVMGSVGYYNEYNRLLIDYKALLGGFFSFYPTANVGYTNNNTRYTATFNDKSASFIFGGQVSVRYFLTRKLAIKGNVAMLFGRGAFQSLIRKDYQDGVQVSESVAGQLGEMSISWINITAGISYTLGR